MPSFAYRRAIGTLTKRHATKPLPGELVSHTGGKPRRRLSPKVVVLGPDNKPIKTTLVLHYGKKAS